MRWNSVMVAVGVLGVAVGEIAAADAEQWWADQPLRQPSVPMVNNDEWCTNGIDRFILAELEAVNLDPAPRATRAALIRRATYDLTGLPPTPEAVAAFVADESPNAWGALIDRLLASDQYGVKWGRHWLDLVRFAETDGYERDRIKPGAWRYRDWVIDAYNSDMPYDQFIVQQLAGDEIDNRTFDSMVATGFLHLGIRDDEPTDPERAIYDDLDGMLDVTCRATLAISMGCARCHDHKKDPLPQRDYYRMLSVFRGLKPYRTGFGNAVRQDNFVRQLALDFGQQDGSGLSRWVEARALARGRIETLVKEAMHSVGGSGAPESIEAAVGWPESGQVLHLDFEGDPELCETGIRGHALRIDSLEDAVEVERTISKDFSITVAFRPDADGPGDDLGQKWLKGAGLVDGEIPGVVNDFGLSWCRGGHVAAGFGNPETFIHSPGRHELGRWHVATLTRRQSTGEVALWVDGERVATATAGTQVLDAPLTLHVGCMHTGTNAFPGAIDEVRLHDRVLRAREILALHESPAFGESAGDLVSARLGMSGALLHGALVSNRLVLKRPVVQVVPTLAAVPREQGAMDTFVLNRGNPTAHGEKVIPGVPQMLGGEALDVQAPSHGQSTGRRLALANWITQKNNPRTARVLANRLWQHHFGRGIAPTPDDFGHLGRRPTHPQLLDWLAVEAISGEWSRKAMHKLIMLSSAYRMDSMGPLDSRDPMNERMHRFEPRRLTAEEVRDSMLAVSGTLNKELGGPSVYPPLPADVLATASRPDDAWGKSSDEQAARRSVFVHVKRSLRHPLLQAFDQADTDAACPVRFTTMPPTQALIMLNSDETNRFAEAFGQRLTSRSGSLRQQYAYGLELVTQTTAVSSDVDDLLTLHDELIADGLSDTVAMKYVCLAMLNLNAFMHVD
jgi:hypothetical protein